MIGPLARLQNAALPQELVSFLGQSHDFDGVVLNVRDRFDFCQSLPLHIFDIVFHAVPVAVVREFRKVVLRHDTELSYLRKEMNLRVSEFKRLVAAPKNGANPLRQNLPNSFFTMNRWTLLPRTVSVLSVTRVSRLFSCMELAEPDPQAPKGLRASACATIRIIGATEIVAVKRIEAACHSGTSNFCLIAS